MKLLNKKKGFWVPVMLISAIGLLGVMTPVFAETVSMNVQATNSSDEAKEKMPVRQNFPREIKREDIVDAGEMKVGYDEENAIYYVYTETNLGPNETKTFKVTVKDVWQIPEGDMDFLKTQAEQRANALEGKENHEQAQNYDTYLGTEINKMKESQVAQKKDIEARVESFRVRQQRLADIRQEVTLLDDFIRASDRYADFQKSKRYIKFTIETNNPSAEFPVEQEEVLRYLPQGVRPENLVDLQGFDLRYDNVKGLFYVSKKVDLKPSETVKYELLISDRWHIPETKLDDLQKTTEEVSVKIAGTPYEKTAAYIVLEIKKYVADIKESQKNATAIEDKIAVYPANAKKEEAIQQKIDQLRKMIDELDKAKITKASAVIKSVTPDIATTWKLIYATIIFLLIISIFFFFLWWGQAKVKQGQKIEDIDMKATPTKEK